MDSKVNEVCKEICTNMITYDNIIPVMFDLYYTSKLNKSVIYETVLKMVLENKKQINPGLVEKLIKKMNIVTSEVDEKYIKTIIKDLSTPMLSPNIIKQLQAWKDQINKDQKEGYYRDMKFALYWTIDEKKN
jgi:hypothetical protein